MMSNPNIAMDRTKVYLVDVSDTYVKLLPQEVKDNAVVIHHNMKGPGKIDGLMRFTAAYELMEKYGSAKLVITQRIYAALPCVAMGTPVIFISSPVMPGGGGTKAASSPRMTGLMPMFHTLDLYNMTTEMAKEWLGKFPWNNIPPNPNGNVVMRLRATAWNVIRQNEAMYDAARKFGLLPLPRPTPGNVESLTFHLIFTTSSKQSIKLFGGVSSSGSLNWKHWRCIESIFHHHPYAKVLMHSNTLHAVRI